MGEVFAAERTADGLHVAIKVVSRSVVDDTLMARLEREAIAARRIKSEFVPEVYDVDRTEEGELFLVMRLLWGVSLSQRLRERGGVLGWDEVRPLVDDVLCGLIDAHAAGVVHRDLKPGNIFIERIDAPTVPSNTQLSTETVLDRERARVLDFGVCKLDASDTEKLTVTGETVGTVSYMAPEQIRGQEVDGRADLYALATLVFELLCGRLPFNSDMQMALLAEKLESRPRRLRECVRVAVPSGLDALLDKALSRKPNDRYASAEQMRASWRALGPAVAPVGASLPVVTQGGVNYSTETGVTAGVSRPAALSSRVGLAIAAGAVVAGALALAFTLRHRTPTEAISSTPISTPSSVAPPVAPPTHSVALSVVELGDAPADAGKPHKPPNLHRPPFVSKPAASASTQGQHITTIPRY